MSAAPAGIAKGSLGDVAPADFGCAWQVIEERSMALTGRFNLRKTFTGRIVLQVEEEARSFWSILTGKNKLHRRWRDATMMDLAAPELRALVDLRFRPRYTPSGMEPLPDREPQDRQRASRHQIEAAPTQVLHYEPYDGRFPTH
ncbi:hypothetical protein [Microvirga roseola]|uniref:hypothetical protein n=1 Tax=Microvirga roseola TaxID=2883126 RepID=UPI001E4361D6|nr:hypothetical protein [Microvirga roseola]